MKRIAQLEKQYMRDDLPEFKSGDTVRVHVRIKEGDKERIQVFQGDVIGRRGGGTGASFTVRKMSNGIGVERIFPLNSPNVAKVERVRKGLVRRSKLYYLRELTGKSARIKEVLTTSAKKAQKTKKTKKSAAKPAEDKSTEA
ncbi:MAG: 50S ribosomal protein L19 [candidate division Zixibacteria bacterium]|nr:50S ribosomal protein L19 [candidate division Zixibacteria bacterium]